MRSRLRAIEDLGDLSGKPVVLRSDLNVPLQDGTVADDSRILAALPTLRELLDAGAAVVACSHLGRPKGRVVESLRMRPVADRLSEVLSRDVRQAPDVSGPGAQQAARDLPPGSVLLLENLRFDPREESNDPSFADELASLGESYVDDAFGAAHREHASVVGVAQRLPSAAGRLMEREVQALARLLDGAEKPFVAILGGAKVSDKLPAVNALVQRADALLVGGAMAFSFLASRGGEVGKSLVEPQLYQEVRQSMKVAEERGVLIQLPEDVVAAPEPSLDARHETVEAMAIPAELMGLDIGPRTVEEFARTIADARTVFWNGPMGLFEREPFSAGTRGVAQAVAACDAFSVVGGGDSLAALRRFDLEAGVDHLSTGGGASLEFLEGRPLPGVAVLMEGT